MTISAASGSELAAMARAAWPTGVAPSAHPPTTWSESSNLKWKVKLPGEGSASPIIWDNLIFIQTAIPTGNKKQPNQPKAEAPAPRRGGMGGEKPSEVHKFVAALPRSHKTGRKARGKRWPVRKSLMRAFAPAKAALRPRRHCRG